MLSLFYVLLVWQYWSCLLVVWLRFLSNKFGHLFDRPNTCCTYFLHILSMTSLDPHISQERGSCGNILLICRHEILGWSLGVTILYCIYTVCEGFLTKWRENADFLIPMLQIISHCSISSLAVPWLCSLVPALTILSSGELIPAARFRSCSISSLAVPWLGSLVPDLTILTSG